jgi:nicotinate phosphoribosyltransferase
LQDDEFEYLQKTCSFFSQTYLEFLRDFRFKPAEHVKVTFIPSEDGSDLGEVRIFVGGLWIDTILYEIPLLALTSEAYFKFCDTDWDHEGQEENAYQKGVELLKYGIAFSEFGTRRRRDYRTHELIMHGLSRASRDVQSGRLVGSSNVHLSMKFNVTPVGTVAHEWFMGIAASVDDYRNASEKALECWIDCFGEGVLGIALTDTFGTPAFLKAFAKPLPNGSGRSYAESFAGVRQDSGDPEEFVKMMREFYDKLGIGEKTIIFSDSLNVEKSKRYNDFAKSHNFYPSFGIGTFFTSMHSFPVCLALTMPQMISSVKAMAKSQNHLI